MLPEDHLAWRMRRVCGRLDISAVEGWYRADGQGEAAYDPRMMVTLVFYCLLTRRRSVRAMAAACVDDLGAIVIAGGQRPSFATFSRFLTRHRAALKGLFTQVLGMCAQEGLAGAAVLAIDGSPMSGNAALSSNVTADKLEEMIAGVEREVEELTGAVLEGAGRQGRLEGCDDDDDDDDGGVAGGGRGLGRPLAAKLARLARLRHARTVLAARTAARCDTLQATRAETRAAAATDRLAAAEQAAAAAVAADTATRAAAAAAGRPAPRGRKPVGPRESADVRRLRDRAHRAREHADKIKTRAEASRVTVSATDPDSRIVPRKGGGWIQGYNFQLGALRRQVAAYVGIHDSPTDQEALVSAVRGAATNAATAGISPWDPHTLADCGYASGANFQQLADVKLLVSTRREAATTGYDDNAPTARASWADMTDRFTQPGAADTYKQRGALVEPGFAQFFARFGRTITRRGTPAADAEIHLLATAFNLAKLITSQHRKPQATPHPA